MKKTVLILLQLLLCQAGMRAWEPVGDHIRTRWAAEVSPENVLPEYPRPQMIRNEWLNLNGLWDYSITAADEAYAGPDGKILVPFCIESSLSGVGKRVGQENALWYEREFTVPRAWKEKHVLLHFGAVDLVATVFVNGRECGTHRGG